MFSQRIAHFADIQPHQKFPNDRGWLGNFHRCFPKTAGQGLFPNDRGWLGSSSA